MKKSEEILFEYGFAEDVYGDEKVSLLPLTIIDMMEEYAEKFGTFLLKNAMLNIMGKLYLKLTDAEIEQIIGNAIIEFNYGSDTKSTV